MLYYEEYDDDVDYNDEDIKMMPKLIGEVTLIVTNNVDYDDYHYRRPLAWSYITDVSSRSGHRYDKHGREIPELGSYYNSKPRSLAPHTEEEDDIDARLAALDQKLMVHNLRILTLENAEGDNEKMEEGELEHLPQYTHFSNKREA